MTTSPERDTVPHPITVPTDGGAMPASMWLPEAGSGPGLLMLQEIFGVSDYIQHRSADLARLGYVVIAPELYWRLGDQKLDESSPDVLSEAMGMAGQLDWGTTVADAVAALGALQSREEVGGGAGVIGFCFGGGLAFNVAAVADPAVLVSYYGSALGQLLELSDQVTAPSLHHFGLADAYIDQDTQMQIEAAVMSQPDTRFETYEGANHAFDNPNPMFHHPEASAAAWQATTEFLAAKLPVSPTP